MFIPIVLFSYASLLFVAGLGLPGSLQPNLNYRLGGYGHTLSRLNQVKKLESGNLDILFVGSSHAYRGFDTRLFEKQCISSFNLGSSSQTPFQTITLLKRYLAKVKPKYVIYEVYPPTLVADGVESSLDIIANDVNNDYSLSMALKQNHIKIYNNLIYSYLRSLFEFDSSHTEANVNESGTYVNGGYVESKVSHYKGGTFKAQRLVLSRNQLESFEEVLDLISAEGCKVILVFAPITKTRYSSYENMEEFDDLMQNYGTYFNFNQTLELNDSIHFYDSHHLNQLGVNAFNQKLIETLQTNQLIQACDSE